MLLYPEIMKDNNIGNDGVRMICEGLKSNSTLMELNLAGCSTKYVYTIARLQLTKMNREQYWSRRNTNDKWYVKDEYNIDGTWFAW